MRCPSCGHENPTGSAFCLECGAKLELLCPRCQNELASGAKFCNGCGQRLTEDGAPTQPPTPTTAPSLPSSFASGRYQVQRFLGEGGKKRVYLAHDTKLDSDVAVAVIKTEGLDAESLTRVRREAQAMGRLRDHPNIVTVLDIGDEAGQHYIIQELMEGGSVEELLHDADGQRLPLDRALQIAEEVCRALEHAHGRGIIHRDLKPGNIWLAEDGTAKLGDFGLAVAIDRSRLTREGMMVGTATYMPPEQALGSEATPRSDVYALGCVLYEMIAGRPPFLGDDTVAVISQHINTAPVAPSWHNPDVPQALETLIMGLLAKGPEDRPENAAAVSQELRRIRDSATPAPAALQPASPAADIRGVDWGRFVGRREEIDQLNGVLENVLSGSGSLVMLVGEPGIGKTRLAEEFGVYASLRGAQVLTGRCYEGEVAIPYRPFVEAFRQYVRGRPDPELRQELGEGAPEVAKLVSEVHQRFPDIPEAAPLEAEAERLRLFESVSAFVCNAAQASPLVLFLDDIHWADKPSLLMLCYLARAITGDRVLILGAYRDVELDRTHPLSEVIATLRREQPYKRILLRGLPEDDVLALVTAIEPSEEIAPGRQALAAAVYQETEGNPFFVREVLSHLVEEGKLVREGGHWTSNVTSPSELGIPEGIRDVVGRRLSRLSEGCNGMLTLASTMTGGFSWEELKAISGQSEEALLDILDEALAHQVISERRGDHGGTYDFTHALIRQTLYDELSTPRRVILHRRIGEALEELHGDNLEPHLAQLAHHFYQAAPGGDVDKAIDYATRAGDRAVEVLAYEEAASHYELALQALDLKEQPDERRRHELLMALGTACSHADVPEHATATLEQAVQLAETLDDPQLQGETACAYADAVWRGPLAYTGTAVAALERAIEAVGKEDSAVRARSLAALSRALDAGPRGRGPVERRLELARDARQIGERSGDFAAQAEALAALYLALPGPERTEERLGIANERVQAAEETGDSAQVIFARLARLGDLAELGEMKEMEREISVISDLADETREIAWGGLRPCWSCMLALIEGRYDDAERFLLQYLPVALRTQHPNWQNAMRVHLYDIRRGQGRLGELEQILLEQVEDGSSLVEAGLALLYAETERPDQAREWFERLSANDFAEVDRVTWIATMGVGGLVARRLRDRRRAAVLYDILRPYAARNIVVGSALLCAGSASWPLGTLAATMGNWADAEHHFEDALVFNEKIGARPWLARTQYEYADMLHERGQTEDLEKAQTLVNQALATFEELGMPKDVERALALKLELQGVSSTDAGTSIYAVASAVRSEQPDLRPHAAPDGTVTLLFTDIEGSTATAEKLGDDRWLTIIRAHNAIVREQLAAHAGVEVANRGDGFMVAFQSPRAGILCALAMQRAFVEYNREHSDETIAVRIGLHTGEPARDEDTFYGTDVNVTARIADDVAQGGEIVASSRLKGLLEDDDDIRFDVGREVELKGLSGTQRVHAVAWEQS